MGRPIGLTPQPIVNKSPGANTDILPADLLPTNVAAFRVTVVLNGAANLKLQIKTPSALVTGQFKASDSPTTLAAGGLYFFVFGVSPVNKYNLQIDAAVQVNYLQIEECDDAVI